MRILVVTAWAPWNRSDGASLVLRHHLRILAPRHEITVLAAGCPTRERIVRGDAVSLPDGINARWFGTTFPRGFDYALRRAASVRSGEPAHVHWVERRAMMRAIADEIAVRRPDVLHLHGWGTAQLWRLASGVPTIHVAIDAWGLGMSNRLMPRWRTIADIGELGRVKRHERRHYPRCGTVVVVAEADTAYLREHAPDARVEVVPNGVEPGPPPGRCAQDPVLGFHGAFETAANRDAALMLAREIYPHVKARMPRARLLLIGRDPGPEIRRLAGNGIEVTGSVPDVRAWLNQVAVYVAPMVSGTGLKNKVLEAMAAGLPVVGTPEAFQGIGEGPGIVVAASPGDIAEQVLDLLERPQERSTLGAGARERVTAEFSWERCAEAVERLWRRVAGHADGT